MAKHQELEWEESSGNVFADLELDQPEELLARSKLLHQVSVLVQNSKLSQKKVAKKLGISQPKVSMLVNGCISEFSTDSLLLYLSILGCDVEIRVKRPRTRLDIFRHRGCIAVC